MFLGRRACVAGLACLLAAFSQTQAQTGTALVRSAPTINGRVEGSIQVMNPENVTLGNGAIVTGNLFVPGSPAVALGANAIVVEELPGPGAAMPAGHLVTLAIESRLGRLVKQTDAVAWPALLPVPPPSGTQAKTMSAPNQAPSDFSVVRALAYIGTTGEVAVPPGNYGNFVANRAGGGFMLGRAGDTEPAFYSFQSLVLDGGSRLRIVGPVIVRVGTGRFTGDVGEVAHPEWLQLQLGSAWTVAAGKQVHAEVMMPTATLTLGAGSTFSGRVQADQLNVGSGAVLSLLQAHPAPPITAGFESIEGYTLGALHGQSDWLAGGGVTITDADAASGQRAVLLPEQTPPASLLRLFASSSHSAVFADLFLLPHAAADVSSSAQLALHSTARLGFVRVGEQGRFMYLVGDGSGGGEWRQSPVGVPLDAQGFAADWLRVTLRLDYAAKEWDFYVNGTMTAAGVGFIQASQTNLTALRLTGQTAASTLMDDVLVAFDNPLFPDADHDGMADAWETAKGLNPALNDRTADADEDGLSNLREFALGTDPSEPDTDHDGLTDGQEVQASTDPRQLDTDGDGLTDALEVLLGYNPTQPQAGVALDIDADGDGLTLRQELTLGTDPAVIDALGDRDSDGDGLPDQWEVTYGLNPLIADVGGAVNEDQDADGLTLIHEARVDTNPNSSDTDGDGLRDGYEVHRGLNPLADDSEADSDGDGLNNREEYRRGTDPLDYYNGREHEILPLIGGDFDLGVGGLMAVRVVDMAGNPLFNAPVILKIENGDSQVSLTPEGTLVGQTAEVRTGPDGIARVYLRTP